MPGTASNSGRCSVLYHSLNSLSCWVSISTYTKKIPLPLWAIGLSSLSCIVAIVLRRRVCTRQDACSPGKHHTRGSPLRTSCHATRPPEDHQGAGSVPRSLGAG